MLPTARADELADPFATELAAPPAPGPAILEEAGATAEIAEPASLPEVAPISTPPFLRQVGMMQGPAPQPIDAGAFMMAPQVVPQQPGYVQLGAPLYPSPRPNIPIWTGSTMITNQAFAPHEMLYPHTYRATYPPYYHRVKGGWILTPFGIRSHERWELQGTQVQVKYRSQHPGLMKGFWLPPLSSSHHH
jgi:hypothetical protein